MRSKAFSATLIVAISAVSYQAHAACNYNSDAGANCKEAVKDWMTGSGTHDQSGSLRDAQKRATSGGKAAKECISCAWDSVDSGTDNATTSSDSDN